ncbi:MAG TPA: DUF871 family protein [Candidatus Atopostipes pullistercoris]|uniref:DUF871 family protein n=1 Tax=Candidatus Atopostipes pullistercoris TaxID=2838467 RepID=A0A9D2G3G5_9LACT|nr:DUF871 family protein [Candidatus Atopostipes pullistercoris]
MSMLGASLYLAEGTEKNLAFIDRMHDAGVQTIFTSMHIPEEDPSDTLDSLKQITKKMNENGMELMIDVSSDTFNIYNIKKEEAKEFFADLGVSSLRMDYGFSYSEMKELSENFKVVLNASTINDETSQELEAVGFDLSEITVCHNFYPRENTGLGREFLYERNAYLHDKGYQIQAFIVGDKEKRGPIYAGLPTLEEHRHADPLYAYLDLTKNFFVDEVLVGDIEMSENSLKRLEDWMKDDIISLPMKEWNEELPKNFYEVHVNRPDVAEDVVRSSQSRIVLKDEVIKPLLAAIERPVGTITIDNERYGRYAGEIQITKRDLPADERINILGRIKKDAVPLLSFIQARTKFTFL